MSACHTSSAHQQQQQQFVVVFFLAARMIRTSTYTRINNLDPKDLFFPILYLDGGRVGYAAVPRHLNAECLEIGSPHSTKNKKIK